MEGEAGTSRNGGRAEARAWTGPRHAIANHSGPFLSEEWQHADEHKANLSAAKNLGYKDLGTFGVEEMPGLQLNALVKAAESSYCIIYEHPVVGMFCDALVCYENKQALTVSSAPTGHQMDVRPGQKKLWFKGQPFSELYAQMQRELCDLPLRPIDDTPEQFIAIFQQAYANDMDWRNSRGGATIEEIRRVAESSGKTYSEEVIIQTKIIQEQRAREATQQMSEADQK